MWKQFSLQGNYKWLKLLPDITKQYNNSYHRTIKTKPSMINKRNEKLILKSIYTHVKITNMQLEIMFESAKIGKYSTRDTPRTGQMKFFS
jgi:hypothetical protein